MSRTPAVSANRKASNVYPVILIRLKTNKHNRCRKKCLKRSNNSALITNELPIDSWTCRKFWKFQTRMRPSSSRKFIERQTPSVEIILWVCCGSSNPGLVTQIALAKERDEISSGFLSAPCILSWNQNNFRGSFRPRLHSVNLGKVSKSESNEWSCAVDSEPSEASCCVDKAASESRHLSAHAHEEHTRSII